jgi:hypothetical protein
MTLREIFRIYYLKGIIAPLQCTHFEHEPNTLLKCVVLRIIIHSIEEDLFQELEKTVVFTDMQKRCD